jgi:hypothetical protein
MFIAAHPTKLILPSYRASMNSVVNYLDRGARIFIYLFLINRLLSDGVNSSDYTTSNDRMISKQNWE